MAEQTKKKPTCEDCIHRHICRSLVEQLKYYESWARCDCLSCKHFKNTADVVEVVRCKDCKAFNGDDKFCKAWEAFVRETDFCSYGERRESDETR